jgi:hypothetical protein
MFRRVAGNCHIRFLWLIRPFLLVRFRRARKLRQTTPLGNPDTLKSFAHSLLPTREDARCGKRVRTDVRKKPLGLSLRSWQDSLPFQARRELLRNQIVQTAASIGAELFICHAARRRVFSLIPHSADMTYASSAAFEVVLERSEPLIAACREQSVAEWTPCRKTGLSARLRAVTSFFGGLDTP